jgi:hypothetical protein
VTGLDVAAAVVAYVPIWAPTATASCVAAWITYWTRNRLRAIGQPQPVDDLAVCRAIWATGTARRRNTRKGDPTP